MNKMLANFESHQRQRQRVRQQYIRDLKDQVVEHEKRKKNRQFIKKRDDNLFQQKIIRERLELKRRQQSRKAILYNGDVEHAKLFQSSNPQKPQQNQYGLIKSAFYVPFRHQSSLSIKDYSRSEILSSKPEISMMSNISYLKAKHDLLQQKQKILRFRTQIRHLSRRTFRRKTMSALQNLKHLTWQIQNTAQNTPYINSFASKRLSTKRQPQLRSVNQFRY